MGAALRWIVLGPACVASAFAGHFIFWMLMGGVFSRAHADWSLLGWMSGGNLAAILTEGAGSVAFSVVPVCVAAYVAPSHKRNTAFTVAVAAWTVSAIALALALLTREWWSAYACVAQLCGAAIGWTYARGIPAAPLESPGHPAW